MSTTTRKSARLSAKPSNVSSSSSSTTTTASAPAPKRQQRSIKKQKTTAAASENCVEKEAVLVQDKTNYSRVRGRRGQLKIMTEMPTDILLEIFSQLQPLDLLHLTRATKFLRGMLTGSNTTYLWKLVYNNVPTPQPPPCPADVNIIHYTNFLFGRHCQFCSSLYGCYNHFSARIRFCGKCVPKYLIQQKEYEVSALCTVWYIRKPGDNASGAYALRAQHNQRVKELAQAKAIGPEAEEILKKKCLAESSERYQFGQRVNSWRYQIRSHKANRLAAIMKERKNDIVKKITEEGYGTELESLRWQLSRLPGVSVGHELTEKEWGRIRADIIDVLQENRERKAEDIICAALRIRYSKLEKLVQKLDMPVPCVIPPITEIAVAEPFSSFIKEIDLTDDKKVDPFAELELAIHEFIASWRASAEQHLLTLIPKSKSSAKGKKKMTTASSGKGKEKSNTIRLPLELATTFFKCHWCSDPITYPRVLMHHCLRQRRSNLIDQVNQHEGLKSNENDMDEADEEAHLTRQRAAKAPRPPREVNVETAWKRYTEMIYVEWNLGKDQVHFDAEASGFSRNIIQACGEDPNTISFSEMENKDARLECMRCNSHAKKQKRLVMNWKMAILHDIEVHFEEETSLDDWKLLSEEDTIEAKNAEVKLEARWRPSDHMCKHCNCLLSRDPTAHLRHVHKIDVDADGFDSSEHIYVRIDYGFKRPPFAVKI